MRIDVTWGDIWFGKPANATNCPVAHAVRRAGFICGCVGYGWIVLWSGGRAYRCVVPEYVEQFTIAFDLSTVSRFALFRVLRFRPFSFELTVPEVLQQNSAEIRAGVDVIGLGDVDCFVSTAKPDTETR